MRQVRKIVKELSPQLLYESLEDKYDSQKLVPEQVFKNAIQIKVFNIYDFFDDQLKSFIDLSKAENARSVFWLPPTRWNRLDYYVEIDLLDSRKDLNSSISDQWEELDYTFLSEGGCLYNDKMNWIVQVSMEFEIIIMGVFEHLKDSWSHFHLKPYTKQTFLDEFEFRAEEYEGVSYSYAKKDSEKMNTTDVYPIVKNYFK